VGLLVLTKGERKMKDMVTERRLFIDPRPFIDEMAKPIHGFSRSGASALFDYLTELEDALGEDLVFDPIAFRCDFTEYANFEEILADYDSIKSMDELRENTQVIEFDDGIIIQAF